MSELRIICTDKGTHRPRRLNSDSARADWGQMAPNDGRLDMTNVRPRARFSCRDCKHTYELAQGQYEHWAASGVSQVDLSELL